MYSKYVLSIAICFMCMNQLVLSQTKNEQEVRIAFFELPKHAQEIIEPFSSSTKRLRFYKETDQDKKSFEAKFKYQKKHYSVEFSPDGILEDIEIITKLKNIEPAIRAQINKYFKKEFDKHKLIKIQKQFVYSKNGEESDFVNSILSNTTKIAPNFEIIAEVKTNKERTIREFTFNSDGTFLSERTLAPTSYEHVLY